MTVTHKLIGALSLMKYAMDEPIIPPPKMAISVRLFDLSFSVAAVVVVIVRFNLIERKRRILVACIDMMLLMIFIRHFFSLLVFLFVFLFADYHHMNINNLI